MGEEELEKVAADIEKKTDSNLKAFRNTLSRSMEKVEQKTTSVLSVMTCGMFGKPKTGDDNCDEDKPKADKKVDSEEKTEEITEEKTEETTEEKTEEKAIEKVVEITEEEKVRQ